MYEAYLRLFSYVRPYVKFSLLRVNIPLIGIVRQIFVKVATQKLK
jgi:hypothetical protein